MSKFSLEIFVKVCKFAGLADFTKIPREFPHCRYFQFIEHNNKNSYPYGSATGGHSVCKRVHLAVSLLHGATPAHLSESGNASEYLEFHCSIRANFGWDKLHFPDHGFGPCYKFGIQNSPCEWPLFQQRLWFPKKQ